MLRSLYAGISGMRINQTKLDVIGNNIANSSTTAFKSQSVRFATALSQTQSSASAPSTRLGGINGSQVGLGAQLASIESIMTNGSLQATGRNLDVAIDKGGYFIVSGGPVVSGDSVIQVNQQSGHNITETGNSNLLYTRDGAFTVDKEGNLLTTSGYRVMGYSVTNDDNKEAATAKPSSTVSASGFNFVFGPGSQLNGYKIVLGNIASGTSTGAKVDKVNKEIVLNGDFSNGSSLTHDGMQTAIDLALSTAGISQEITVTGSPTTYPNLTSDKVANGSDPASAKDITIGSFTVSFTQGSALNGYKFVIDDTHVTATEGVKVDGTNIYLSKDYLKGITSGTAPSVTDIQSKINDTLTAAGITTVSVNLHEGSSRTSIVDGASDIISGGADSRVADPVEALGLKFTFNSGASLNGYKIVLGTMSSGTDLSTAVDTKNKTITINGDFVTAGRITADDIKASVNSALADKGIATTVDTLAETTPGSMSHFAGTESDQTFGGTPVQSLAGDGKVYYVDGSTSVSTYDSSLKSLKIPEKVTIAGTGEEKSVVSYTIENTGVINAVLEDGSVACVGQIALATFSNQEGLIRETGNLFSTSSNSGNAVLMSGVNTTGEDNSSAFGSLAQGYLEMSNVDLAEQFTDMITATRAFQANSKSITTGDEILQQIIALKQ